MAAYPDVLNADLFVTTLGSSDAVLVDQNGGVTTATVGSGIGPEQIVLDTADNLYFVVSTNATETQILEGRISNALAGNGPLFSLYTDNTQNPFNIPGGADEISGIQVDTTNHLIYFVDNENGRLPSNETSVFENFSYSPEGWRITIRSHRRCSARSIIKTPPAMAVSMAGWSASRWILPIRTAPRRCSRLMSAGRSLAIRSSPRRRSFSSLKTWHQPRRRPRSRHCRSTYPWRTAFSRSCGRQRWPGDRR